MHITVVLPEVCQSSCYMDIPTIQSLWPITWLPMATRSHSFAHSAHKQTLIKQVWHEDSTLGYPRQIPGKFTREPCNCTFNASHNLIVTPCIRVSQSRKAHICHRPVLNALNRVTGLGEVQQICQSLGTPVPLYLTICIILLISAVTCTSYYIIINIFFSFWIIGCFLNMNEKPNKLDIVD